jgi:nitrogen fixation NifU-like protein
MSDLDELYQSVILDHNRAPRNFRRLDDANAHAEGRNPLCGDHFEVWARVEDGVIREVTFEGQGCAISKASASMMTQAITGKTMAEAEALFARFHGVLTGVESGKLPGKLEVFKGVSAFPIRVKCATLSWHALKQALNAVSEERGAKGEKR